MLNVTSRRNGKVMEDPERYEPSESSPYFLYIGQIEGHERPLFVVVDEELHEIVSAYFQKPSKGLFIS